MFARSSLYNRSVSEARISGNGLRRQIFALQAQRGSLDSAELTFGRSPSVVYAADEAGCHGNFIAASYRRILADAGWRERLGKRYTAEAWLPRAADRRRGELECANSSDALLMNVFCYPGVLRRGGVCGLLGVEAGARPEFGVRAGLRMRRGEIDRTELDMCVGDLAVEAKLTESGFGTASRERATRYLGLEEVFDPEGLPWGPRGLCGYQLVRGVLAAAESERRFLLLCDGRRSDLQEVWFQVLLAVRSSELRSRMGLLTWQELAAVLPGKLREFLREKYGIVAA